MRPTIRPGHGFTASSGTDPPTRLAPMHPPIEMGNPLSVPEDPDLASNRGVDEDPEPLWLKLPVELASYFDLGFVHTDEICPYVVMRVRDDIAPGAQGVEVAGPPHAFAGLARIIVALCESVPCLANHIYDEAFEDQRQAG